MSPCTRLCIGSFFLLGAGLAGAQVNRYAMTESYTPPSPEVPAVHEAGDVVVVNSTQMGGGGRQWPHLELGLLPGQNLDAFSTAVDIFPSSGPAVNNPPLTCGYVLVEHTVDPETMGAPGEVVDTQAMVGGNGAASDTFAAHYRGGSPTFMHTTDHLDVSPRPDETDLDALDWLERKRYPVYFSVDAETAAAPGFPFGPADILISFGAGAHFLFLPAGSLGLVDGDDIDALAIDAHDGGLRFVFSLSRTSPSVLSGGSLATVTPAGLAIASTSTAPAPWAFPPQLALDPTNDNLNGVRITDPVYLECLDGSQTGTNGLPYECIKVAGTSGNIRHMVDLPSHEAFSLLIDPIGVGDPVALFFTAGRPCRIDKIDFAWGSLTFTSPFEPVIFFGQVKIPVNLNTQVEFTVQGATRGADMVTHHTNAITVDLY